MGRQPRDVTDAELAVLQLLWEQEDKSIRELTDTLYPGGTNSEFATVQKLCERLQDKGLVRVDRRKRPKRFAACVDRQSLLSRKLRSLADELCSGSFAPLMSQLLQGGRFSGEELRKLRDEVEKLQRTREDDR